MWFEVFHVRRSMAGKLFGATRGPDCCAAASSATPARHGRTFAFDLRYFLSNLLSSFLVSFLFK